MKIAKIIPIYKSGEKDIFNNYRPISLLPALSKFMEKIVAKRLVNYFNRYDLFFIGTNTDSGKKHSTIHPILHFLNHIANQKDISSKNIIVVIFFYFLKAFDTISHKILLEILEFYGIRGNANNWFRSYLQNRKQFLEIYNIKSEYADITCGVPQGSILGPILFLIYIYDIGTSSKLNLLSFADDTTLYQSGDNYYTLVQNLNNEVNNTFKWLCANRLSLNIKKTKYMIFNLSQAHANHDGSHSIHINNTPFIRVGSTFEEKTITFLGLNIDDKLTWKKHISQICSKISLSIFFINKVKYTLPAHALKSLYYSLIHCHMIYGLPAWGRAQSVNKIFILQKRTIRTICKQQYRNHTNPLFKKENILKLNDLHNLQVSLFMHDYRHSKLPISFHNFFVQNTHAINLRNNQAVHRERARTKFSSKLPKHNFPLIWNQIDTTIKEIPSKQTFNKTLMKLANNTYSENAHCSNIRCLQCHEK